MARSRVFISYSHKDELWRVRLIKHLSVLESEGLLHVWADNRIAIGDDWQRRIDEAMTDSRTAVLLVTADFLASDFILKREIPVLMQQHERQGMQILPVITRPCPWKLVTWLADRQVRPQNGRPLSSGDEFQVDTDLAALSYEIAAIIGRIDSKVASDEMAGAELSVRQRRLAYSERVVAGSEDVNNPPISLVDAAVSELNSLSSRYGAIPTRGFTELLLKTAITHGAPLFNSGSPLACAIVYSFAATTLVQRLETEAQSSQPASRGWNTEILSELAPIGRFLPASYPDAKGYAWTLRRAFDKILEHGRAG
jgi:hypothetical protein